MTDLSPFRLNLLRAMYLLLVVGLAATIWPGVIAHPQDWPLMNGVVSCMLAALSLLSLLGLLHPLKMLPLLLFELAWKAIWLVAVAFPLWRAGAIDAASAQTLRDFVPAILLLVAIPWRYVAAQYLRAPAERWRADSRPAAGAAEA